VLNKEQRRLYSFDEAKKLCNDIGQACAGFVKESNSPTGLNYFPREKAVLISSSTDEKIRSKNFTPMSVLKICPGEMSQNFPYYQPVSSPIYRSKFSLDIVIPISSSLIYRDMVLFEGLETGIEHEWKIPIIANQEKRSDFFGNNIGKFSVSKNEILMNKIETLVENRKLINKANVWSHFDKTQTLVKIDILSKTKV